MLRKYCEALKGITYSDWIKLKFAVDREFQNRISEKTNSIQLTDSVKLEKLIHSQFGYIQD